MTNEIQLKSEKEEKIEKIEKLEKSTNLESDEEYDFITVPPDGGFGYVVLLACFLINLIIDGFLYTFGAISTDIKGYYKCSEWATTLIMSLACGCYLLSAPVASALCNKWGCRTIGIVGSFIAAVAVASSVISPNIAIMWILFGVIGGTGMGLVYLPSIVMVGYYFEAKRAIATGIVTAGTGIGSIIIPPLGRWLFGTFKWKGGLFILSLILLCCAVCCVFMRPLKPIRKRRMIQSDEIVDEKPLKAVTPTLSIREGKVPEVIITPASIYPEDANTLEVAFDDNTGKRSRTQSAVSSKSHLSAKSGISVKSRQSIKAEDAVRPLYKEDVLYQGDPTDLPEFQIQPDIPTYVQETTKIPEETTTNQNKMKAFWDVFLNMTNFHLLRDKSLIIICVANVFSMFGYYTPYLFIPKLAIEKNLANEKTAVYLLSILGFSNTACRFLSGWITKIPHMSPLLVNNIGLIIAGATTLFATSCSSYFTLALYCIVWGGFIAFHISLSPVIVCQMVGLELYSNALGLTLMFRGITSLAGPPILGGMRDATSSFTTPFVVSGFCLIISALIHFSLMWINRPAKVETDQAVKNNQAHENPAVSGV